MHYPAELWVELSPGKLRHFRNGHFRPSSLRQDSRNRFARLGNVNFADFGGFADTFARTAAQWFSDCRSASPGKAQVSQARLK
jgi:hypothetical protein